MQDASTPSGQDSFEAEGRRYARAYASDGMAAFAQAFNHCDEDYHPHKYAPEVQERFWELGLELVALVESGRIEPNPNHRQYLRAQEAKQDKTLQAVLKQFRSTGKRRGRSSHG